MFKLQLVFNNNAGANITLNILLKSMGFAQREELSTFSNIQSHIRIYDVNDLNTNYNNIIMRIVEGNEYIPGGR